MKACFAALLLCACPCGNVFHVCMTAANCSKLLQLFAVATVDTMAVPGSCSVTLNGTQAVMVLDVHGQSAPTAAAPTSPLQILIQKVLDGVPRDSSAVTPLCWLVGCP